MLSCLLICSNGSGKSAILTGITVALGAKAQSTSRARSVKGFVREGEAYVYYYCCPHFPFSNFTLMFFIHLSL
jgi:predicted ATPase